MKFGYEPSCGTHISMAIDDAKQIARETGKPVRFKFNDVILVATNKTSTDSLNWTFNTVLSQQGQTYRMSKRGREAARKRTEQLSRDQMIVDELVTTLDLAIRCGLDEVIRWLSAFAEVADDVGLKYDRAAIARKLTDAGYISGHHVGESDFTQKQVMGEYIVGQAISCLENGMPPHPATVEFAKRYFSL